MMFCFWHFIAIFGTKIVLLCEVAQKRGKEIINNSAKEIPRGQAREKPSTESVPVGKNSTHAIAPPRGAMACTGI